MSSPVEMTDRWRDESQADLHRRLAVLAADVGTLVDAGCGRGAHLRSTDGGRALEAVRVRGGRLIGIDVTVPAEGNPYMTELRLIEGPRWPVETGSVDVVFSDWVLEHVADPREFFSECARVLKPGGRLLARTLQRWSVAGMGARLVPHRFHAAMISRLQPGMNLTDVFPTTLLCNTQPRLGGLATSHGMRLERYAAHRGLAGYGCGKPAFERMLEAAERALPQQMWQTTVFEMVKRPT